VRIVGIALTNSHWENNKIPALQFNLGGDGEEVKLSFSLNFPCATYFSCFVLKSAGEVSG
jgi:hypothetical protein